MFPSIQRATDSPLPGSHARAQGVWIVPSPHTVPARVALGDSDAVDREIVTLIGGAREVGTAELEGGVAAMARAGLRPGPRLHGVFWVLVLLHARRTADVPLAQRAFQSLVAAPARFAAPSANAIEKWREVFDSTRIQRLESRRCR